MSDCAMITYDWNSYNISNQYGFILSAGQGCYVGISRLNNGSYGTMQLFFEDSNILFFD